MQPDNQQLSSDYLNQIAAPAPVKKLNPLFLWGLIGGLLVLAIVAVVAIGAMSGTGTSSSSLTAVASKLENLKKVSESAQKNIQSGELRSLNSSLTLVLTNANRDMAEPLKAKDIKLKDEKKKESVVRITKEFEELDTRLEDARLNAVYDRTYAREMTFALKTLHSDMSVLYKNTRSNSLKEVLDTTDTNIAPLLDEFESFNTL